jgi:hypothetical protein
MSVPEKTREELRKRLWRLADEKQWGTLSTATKSGLYEAWTRDPEIGGVLARFITLSDVRVYLKDTLLKDYSRHQQADDAFIFRVLDIPKAPTTKTYIKPHGRRFSGGRIICWGRANAWKSILMAAYERAYSEPQGKPYAVVFSHTFGQYHQTAVRKMVEDAAKKLGIERILWMDS